jgi:hypothetical protein
VLYIPVDQQTKNILTSTFSIDDWNIQTKINFNNSVFGVLFNQQWERFHHKFGNYPIICVCYVHGTYDQEIVRNEQIIKELDALANDIQGGG